MLENPGWFSLWLLNRHGSDCDKKPSEQFKEKE